MAYHRPGRGQSGKGQGSRRDQKMILEEGGGAGPSTMPRTERL